LRVAVIVDDLDPSRRRRSFWEEQLSELRDVEYDLVSLLQKMEERKFFDVYSYDVVIFNWCLLDGALMFASDRVQDVVAFYDDHFVEFVRKGGVLIMEDQPKRWRPEQKAYDLLLHGDVRVIPRDAQIFASKVLVNERLRKHPLVQHLPPVLHSSYRHSPDESWFPLDSTSHKSIRELHPTKAYAGAFQAWKSDWLPLLYTEDKAKPVMLVKVDGLGVWCVTTMFLASANISDLVERLVLGAQRHCVEIHNFHERQRRVRMWGFVRVVAVLAVVASAVVFCLGRVGLLVEAPYGNTIAGNIVLSLLITAALSLMTLLGKYLWNTLGLALNR